MSLRTRGKNLRLGTAFLLVILAAVLVSTGGCGEGIIGKDGSKVGSSSIKAGRATSGGRQSGLKDVGSQTTGKGSKSSSEPDKMAARVLAQENAPLRSNVTGKDASHPGKRSVPLGRTLLAGKRDPSDGVLKGHRIVAFYGTPLSPQMGVLGEHGPGQTMRHLKKQTRAYSAADPEHPAVPAIELISSVAQQAPGSQGLYVSPLSPATIERYARLARENHALLILDIQPGRDSVMDEVRALEPFLRLPYVHLAIDTEYHVGPGQIPGKDLGHMDGSEIEQAVKYLNQLVEKENIPDKVVLVHQFQEGVVSNKHLIKPTRHVEVVLNADGFGKAQDKLAKYRILVRQEPIQYGGFKLFYGQDAPLLSPKQVVRMDPAPAVVDYQ